MRIVRFGEPGHERPGVLTSEGRLLDATSLVDDWTAEHLDPSRLASVSASLDKLPQVDADAVRLGAPIARPGKIVCIGLNYADHAAESGATIPDEPVVFMKDPSTVVGPHDSVLVPRGSQKTDFEVELAVVVGRQIRYAASADEALACVAGYATSNDLSEREFQLERGGQWDKGKSCETFNPLGPWMVTADEVPDPQALALELWVNGELQSSTTAEMVFSVRRDPALPLPVHGAAPGRPREHRHASRRGPGSARPSLPARGRRRRVLDLRPRHPARDGGSGMSGTFTGMSVLITGGASGIGRATALMLLSQGARVASLDLVSSGEAEREHLRGGWRRVLSIEHGARGRTGGPTHGRPRCRGQQRRRRSTGVRRGG